MNNLKYILLILVSISIISCTKDEEEHEVENKVTFDIHSPVEGQEYANGDTIFMHGTANGTASLHGYELTAKDLSNGSTIFTADDHVHGNSVAFDTFLVNNVVSPRQLAITFKVAIDHEGNTAEKVVKINAN
ncbi:MAG: hypothetical protein IPO45_13895 [Saprospiraceae bacterium]|nr:hypothetical protein [Candidatus Brachybacter algidus]